MRRAAFGAAHGAGAQVVAAFEAPAVEFAEPRRPGADPQQPAAKREERGHEQELKEDAQQLSKLLHQRAVGRGCRRNGKGVWNNDDRHDEGDDRVDEPAERKHDAAGNRRAEDRAKLGVREQHGHRRRERGDAEKSEDGQRSGEKRDVGLKVRGEVTWDAIGEEDREAEPDSFHARFRLSGFRRRQRHPFKVD